MFRTAYELTKSTEFKLDYSPYIFNELIDWLKEDIAVVPAKLKLIYNYLNTDCVKRNIPTLTEFIYTTVNDYVRTNKIKFYKIFVFDCHVDDIKKLAKQVKSVFADRFNRIDTPEFSWMTAFGGKCNKHIKCRCYKIVRRSSRVCSRRL